MSVDAHLQSLTRRHQEAESAIALEMKHPHADESKVHELKRLKLKLKDQMESLRRRDTSS